jgi:hypothetical protein
MANTLRHILKIRRGLTALVAWLGIFILPIKIKQLPEAWHDWASIMPNQETLWMIFSGALVAWIFWIDLRPFIYAWMARNAGDIDLRHLILWIERHSAWWRWKVAQGAIGPNKWANYNIVAAELYDQAKTGELTISARPKNKIERENISKDFWQLAILEVKMDDRTLLRVIVRPLAKDDEEKINELGYVDLMARWKEVLKLWPEKDRELGRQSKNLLKQAKTK